MIDSLTNDVADRITRLMTMIVMMKKIVIKFKGVVGAGTEG